MNYYERHIGDYLKDTAHLPLLEHGVYARLLDVYYTREGGLPDSQVARLIGARTREEKDAVQAVLSEFFVRVDDLWTQARCDREIERYQGKQAKAKASADARWNKDRPQSERNANAFLSGDASNMRSHCEGNALQSPDTNHHISPSLRSGENRADKPRSSRRSGESKTLKTYLAECKTAQLKPIPDDHFIRGECEAAGITVEMLQVAWVAFRRRYTEDEKGKGKRYKDWPGHFANAVRGRWGEIWYIDQATGKANWSSTGLQLKAVLDAKHERGADHE